MFHLLSWCNKHQILLTYNGWHMMLMMMMIVSSFSFSEKSKSLMYITCCHVIMHIVSVGQLPMYQLGFTSWSASIVYVRNTLLEFICGYWSQAALIRVFPTLKPPTVAILPPQRFTYDTIAMIKCKVQGANM